MDINRDAHQLAFEATRAVHRMFFDYHPQVVHDLHEAIPLLQTWNGTGPYNPNLDPIVLSEFLEMSLHEVTTLTALGMPGVWTWDFGEGFGHHYLDSIAMNHNAIGRGYETFGNATAETVDRDVGEDATQPRVVPAGAAAGATLPLVDARQRQLPADGGAGHPRPRRRASRRNTCGASIARAELLAGGRRGHAVRVRDPARSGRPPAGGRARQPAKDPFGGYSALTIGRPCQR